MVIQVLFVVLILSTAAIIAVGLAIHFRVKRHLDGVPTEPESTTATQALGQDDIAADIAEASEEDNHGQSSDRDTRDF